MLRGFSHFETFGLAASLLFVVWLESAKQLVVRICEGSKGARNKHLSWNMIKPYSKRLLCLCANTRELFGLFFASSCLTRDCCVCHGSDRPNKSMHLATTLTWKHVR